MEGTIFQITLRIECLGTTLHSSRMAFSYSLTLCVDSLPFLFVRCSQGCHFATGFCRHLKYVWSHWLVLLACCLQSFYHWALAKPATNPRTVILLRPKISELHLIHQPVVFFGQVRELVRIEGICFVQWALQVVGFGVKPSRGTDWRVSAPLSFLIAEVTIAFPGLTKLRIFWVWSLLIPAVAAFAHQSVRLKASSCAGSIFVLDKPSSLPKRVSRFWRIPAACSEGDCPVSSFSCSCSISMHFTFWLLYIHISTIYLP